MWNRLELFLSLAEVKESFNNVEKWSKEESAPLSLYSLTSPKIRKEAKGVVLIFVPYNYPIFLLMSPIVSVKIGYNSHRPLHVPRPVLSQPETPFVSRLRSCCPLQALSSLSFSLSI